MRFLPLPLLETLYFMREGWISRRCGSARVGTDPQNFCWVRMTGETIGPPASEAVCRCVDGELTVQMMFDKRKWLSASVVVLSQA